MRGKKGGRERRGGGIQLQRLRNFLSLPSAYKCYSLYRTQSRVGKTIEFVQVFRYYSSIIDSGLEAPKKEQTL